MRVNTLVLWAGKIRPLLQYARRDVITYITRPTYGDGWGGECGAGPPFSPYSGTSFIPPQRLMIILSRNMSVVIYQYALEGVVGSVCTVGGGGGGGAGGGGGGGGESLP